MKQFEVIDRAARLSAGRVKLTAAQAKPRAHALKALGGGVFEIVQPVEFKRGEVIEYDQDPGKAMALVLAEPKGRARNGGTKPQAVSTKPEGDPEPTSP